jgi:putative membrane protein
MTGSSERAEALVAQGARRLHPWSWLFVLLAQLREFALPLLALLVFGRGGDWQEAAAGIAALGLSFAAVVRYYTYRFRIERDQLVVRSGLLTRGERHVPFARISNVVLQQNLLHRLFRVAEVRLESATAGVQAEAQMRVLSLQDAEALESLVRAARRGEAGDGSGAPSEPDSGQLLLQVPLAHLHWLGLSSDRGMVVLGAIFGIAWQLEVGNIGRLIANAVEAVYQWIGQFSVGLSFLATALAIFVGLSLLLRVLGVLVTVLRFHGFSLREEGARLSAEGGLLTRLRAHVPVHKVQRWVLGEPWLLRWRGLRTLNVETAGHAALNEERVGEALVPVAPAAQADALLQRWLPEARLDTLDWQPVHPRAWRRWAFWPTLILAAVLGAQLAGFGLQALPMLALLPLPILHAQASARFAGWARRGSLLFWRYGWLEREWQVIELARIQVLRLRQSPFDRRAGMASLVVDSAGASPQRGVTVLRSLPVEVARALQAALAAELEANLLAPEARGEQDQHREHFQTPEQHAEDAQPDCQIVDRGEVAGDLAQPGTEVGEGGDGGAEGAQDVQPGGVHRQHHGNEAEHPQGDEAGHRQHHAL